MSVFSKIILSKKAAKEHKQKAAEKEKGPAEDVKTPYKHVPTHAAVDALSGAPSSWKHEDRPKIREHHKRRSQMVISRTGSTLSTMSNAIGRESSSQIPPLPRNSSYNSYSPTWFDRGGETYYSTENTSRKFKQARGHSYHDSGIGPSPLGSKNQSEEASPVVSSGNSTNSNSSDNLEIAPSKGHRISQRPQPIVYAERDIFDRLHTSTTRKLGEAPLHESAPVKPKAPAVVVQEAKPKKQRWSLMGKRNSAAVAAH